MKKCVKCNIEKEFDYFYKDNRSLDGLYSSCKTCHKNRSEKWRLSNFEKVAENSKKYQISNKEKIKNYIRDYVYNRRKEDFLFYFKERVKGNISKSFKRGEKKFNKKLRCEEILGCSIYDFKNYIQSKFSKGMTFNNFGEWHLDHIVPLSTAKTEDDVVKLCHYTNYQPLWAEDNLKKGNKIINTQLKLI
jgi:hypothetical protein